MFWIQKHNNNKIKSVACRLRLSVNRRRVNCLSRDIYSILIVGPLQFIVTLLRPPNNLYSPSRYPTLSNKFYGRVNEILSARRPSQRNKKKKTTELSKQIYSSSEKKFDVRYVTTLLFPGYYSTICVTHFVNKKLLI